MNEQELQALEQEYQAGRIDQITYEAAKKMMLETLPPAQVMPPPQPEPVMPPSMPTATPLPESPPPMPTESPPQPAPAPQTYMDNRLLGTWMLKIPNGGDTGLVTLIRIDGPDSAVQIIKKGEKSWEFKVDIIKGGPQVELYVHSVNPQTITGDINDDGTQIINGQCVFPDGYGGPFIITKVQTDSPPRKVQG